MNIAAVCHRHVVTVTATASLCQAALLMRDQHVGALVVTDPAETERVLGVVTDRDLAIEVLARDPDGRVRSVGDIASRSLVAVAATASVQDAIDAMERSGVRRLLVTDHGHDVIGILSADELIEAIAIELSALAAALRGGVTRERAERVAAEGEFQPVFLPSDKPRMH